MTYMSADELSKRVREGAARGLNLVALRVQAVAIPLTPLEVGDLRSSLVVTEAKPGQLVASVSSDLVYAVAQHERLDYRHTSGGAKFLEKASLLVGRADAERIMATAVARAIGA